MCTLSNEGHEYTIPETWLNSKTSIFLSITPNAKVFKASEMCNLAKLKSGFIPVNVSISTLNPSVAASHGISDYARLPALNPLAAIFYPRFLKNDKIMQCYSFIITVFKDRSNGFSTLDVYGNCFNPSSFTLYSDVLHFSPNMFRSFTLNPNAPDFYPGVTILDSQVLPIGTLCTPTPLMNLTNRTPVLKQLRLSNSNKFEMLIDIVKGTVDVLVISETKLDDSFPLSNSVLMDTESHFVWIEIHIGVVSLCSRGKISHVNNCLHRNVILELFSSN